MISKTKFINSPMTYRGSKRRILHNILDKFPSNINNFYDLFTGSGTVGINANSNTITCNDTIKELIELYNYFKNNKVDDILTYIDNRIKEFNLIAYNKENYLKFRDYYNGCTTKHPLDFYLLTVHSFCSQIEFNIKGEFNTAVGSRYFNPNKRNNLINFVNAIHSKDVKFTNQDFKSFDFDSLTTEDFIYLDPPYLATDTTFYKSGWSNENEIYLLDKLDNLNKRGVKFGLSNIIYYKNKTNKYLEEFVNSHDNLKLYSSELVYSTNKVNDENKMDLAKELLIVNY